jgi:hypothetical protein
MKKLLVSCIAGAAALGFAGAANAVIFQFKGDGGTFDSPTNAANVVKNCGSIGVDLCTIDHVEGFDYSKDGVAFTVNGFANGVAARLIQDVEPANSGIGVLSEMDQEQDQTQFDSLEIIEFVFNQVVTLLNIEFNAGNDTDCSTPGGEGPCGDFDLYIDDVFFASVTADDLLANPGWTGTKFSFRPTTAGAGFNIAQFEIEAIPVPGALLLLLTGLGGLSFASRGKRKIA